jgi:2-dehydro-3-deoxyphosphogluconate aldolase/(4S)-4-hydroxy-2-oxoglutarate aldolase
MKGQIIESFKKHQIIVIARDINHKEIIEIANIIIESGIKLLEIALDLTSKARYHSSIRSIKKLSKVFSADQIIIGAGVVTSTKQVIDVYEAGARFIVSPNVREDVIAKTNELKLVSIPRAITHTEACDAMVYGADFVKLVPLDIIDDDYIDRNRATLCHIPFLVAGGLAPGNITNHLNMGVLDFVSIVSSLKKI